MRSEPAKVTGRREGGFSLLEVLVVLAVLAVGFSLVLGVWGRTEVATHRTQCLSNMRQIGLAILNYALDHDGDLPPTRHTANATQAWVMQLRPYLEDVDKVRICPADPRGAQRVRAGGTSYLANDAIFDPRENAFGEVLEGSVANLRRIERPSRTILVFTVSDSRGVGASNDHTHTMRWRSYATFLADVEADRHRVGARSANRTKGDANYLYADGTVRNISAKEMKAHLDQGKNPGLPGMAP